MDQEHALAGELRAVQEELTHTAALMGAVVQYAKTRPVFDGYKATKYSKKYLAQHEAELADYREAKATMNDLLDGAKLPKMDTLKQKRRELSERKKALTAQYRAAQKEMRELTRREYDQLLAAARSTGRERLALLMESICSTGIRVSEVRYLTVDAARCGKVEVALKGKIRAILLPGKLCRKLLKYARKNKIASGEIFLTRSGTSLSGKQIWREMKGLCQRAEWHLPRYSLTTCGICSPGCFTRHAGMW